jgi:hypothetical protein
MLPDGCEEIQRGDVLGVLDDHQADARRRRRKAPFCSARALAQSTGIAGISSRAARAMSAMRVVEAAGIEPASRNRSGLGVYARVSWFVSRPRGAREQAPMGPASLGSRRVAKRRGSPTSPLLASPEDRGHFLGRRLPRD